MKNWTKTGHLTEMALEAWVAGEAEAHELQTMDSHIQACSDCRAQASEWQGLFLALSSLQGVEPSASFDENVMRQVRLPAASPAPAQVWAHRVARKAPRIAAAVIGAWTVTLIGAAAWLQKTVDVPPAMLADRLFRYVGDGLVAVALKVGAFLQLSGLADLFARVTDTVPGIGVAGAIVLMTVLCGLAIWVLYRVIGYQPPRVDAHA
jgi:hypothetical protein